MDRADDPTKKTLAIVFCDIFGFTSLTAEIGELVAANVLRAFYEHAGGLAREHHCVTIKFIGDGLFATFDNLDDAFPFIVAIENLLTDIEIIAQQHLGLKFSLHHGDVLYMETSYGADVLGEPVNIAARLNDLAQPHQLIVSQATLSRLSADLATRAGPIETHQMKRSGVVEFRRIELTAS